MEQFYIFQAFHIEQPFTYKGERSKWSQPWPFCRAVLWTPGHSEMSEISSPAKEVIAAGYKDAQIGLFAPQTGFSFILSVTSWCFCGQFSYFAWVPIIITCKIWAVKNRKQHYEGTQQIPNPQVIMVGLIAHEQHVYFKTHIGTCTDWPQ